MQNRAYLAAIITVSWFNLANITCAHKLCEWYFFAIALIATIWMPLVTFCCSIHCWFQMPTTTLIHTIRKFELFRIIVCTFPALLEYNCVLQTLARKQTEVNFHDRFFWKLAHHFQKSERFFFELKTRLWFKLKTRFNKVEFRMARKKNRGACGHSKAWSSFFSLTKSLSRVHIASSTNGSKSRVIIFSEIF